MIYSYYEAFLLTEGKKGKKVCAGWGLFDPADLQVHTRKQWKLIQGQVILFIENYVK